MKIKHLYLILLLLFSSSSYALTVNEAFKAFYNNDVISSNHCGRNIHHFVNYLEEQNVSYKSGYVVSLHEGFGALNHFDARWGSRELYQDGSEYYRSNWYFHVFAVIDGIAYDFSQAGTKTQPLKDYLYTAYIPAKTTQNIFFQGVISPEKGMRNKLNMEMKVYDIKEYGKDYGSAKYAGTTIELFNYALGNPMRSRLQENEQYPYQADSIDYNEDGSITITEPRVLREENVFPLKADAAKACRVFGYFGARTDKLEYTVSDKQKMLHVYSSLNPKDPSQISSDNITLSFRENETVGGVTNQPLLHYASLITCTDLASYLTNLPL